MRSDAEVDVCAGEGGLGKRILGYGDHRAQAGLFEGRADVEVEGADLAIGARKSPVGGIVEGDMVSGVVEGVAGGRSLRQ